MIEFCSENNVYTSLLCSEPFEETKTATTEAESGAHDLCKLGLPEELPIEQLENKEV